MTIIIPYIGNTIGFSQILVALQPQLHPDDDIYILDMSKDKSALRLAKLYGSTRCYIMVEPTDKPLEQALEYGYQSMTENKQSGALVISDRCVIPSTFIQNMKRAAGAFPEWNIIFPRASVVERGIDSIDPNFKWFNTSALKVVDHSLVDKSEVFDQVFYMANSPTIAPKAGVLTTETVVVLPDFLEGL